DDGNADFRLYAGQFHKHRLKRHAFGQCTPARRLDCRAVRHRIREWNAVLDDRYARSLPLTDLMSEILQTAVTGHDIGDEGFFILFLQSVECVLDLEFTHIRPPLSAVP